jgi:hypothetical protein
MTFAFPSSASPDYTNRGPLWVAGFWGQRVVRQLFQAPTQQEDALAEIGFFHEAVRPNRLHQIVFGNYFLTLLYQHQEYVKHLARWRNRLIAPQQESFSRIDAVGPNLYKCLICCLIGAA